MTQGTRRARGPFVFYTLALVAIAVFAVLGHQWSVAITTLAMAAVFAVITRYLWRKR